MKTTRIVAYLSQATISEEEAELRTSQWMRSKGLYTDTYVAPDTRISKTLALVTPMVIVTRTVVATTVMTNEARCPKAR